MEGTNFVNRQELRESGVHLPTQAGISGSALEGADSIVLSGGYEDDRDEGEVIVYTGEGKPSYAGVRRNTVRAAPSRTAFTVNRVMVRV